jgi:plasmid stability protein
MTNEEIFPFIYWASDHSIMLFAIVAVVFIMATMAIRLRPDSVAKKFLAADIRVPKSQLDQHRHELIQIVVNQSRQAQSAIAQQQLKIQDLKMEHERITHFYRVHPRLVKEVGDTLASIEAEYEKSRKKLKSKISREVLRVATEKRISEVLSSMNTSTSQLPQFSFDDETG